MAVIVIRIRRDTFRIVDKLAPTSSLCPLLGGGRLGLVLLLGR